MAKAENAELVFVPLGGVGEIGMNFALYGYGPPMSASPFPTRRIRAST